jgi:uncharacterized integral membrane protein
VSSINETLQEIVYAVLPTRKVRVVYIVIFFVLMMASALNNLLVILHLWRSVTLFLSIIVVGGFISMTVFMIVRFYQVKRHKKQ